MLSVPPLALTLLAKTGPKMHTYFLDAAFCDVHLPGSFDDCLALWAMGGEL